MITQRRINMSSVDDVLNIQGFASLEATLDLVEDNLRQASAISEISKRVAAGQVTNAQDLRLVELTVEDFCASCGVPGSGTSIASLESAEAQSSSILAALRRGLDMIFKALTKALEWITNILVSTKAARSQARKRVEHVLKRLDAIKDESCKTITLDAGDLNTLLVEGKRPDSFLPHFGLMRAFSDEVLSPGYIKSMEMSFKSFQHLDDMKSILEAMKQMKYKNQAIVQKFPAKPVGKNVCPLAIQTYVSEARFVFATLDNRFLIYAKGENVEKPVEGFYWSTAQELGRRPDKAPEAEYTFKVEELREELKESLKLLDSFDRLTDALYGPNKTLKNVRDDMQALSKNPQLGQANSELVQRAGQLYSVIRAQLVCPAEMQVFGFKAIWQHMLLAYAATA